MKNVYFTLCTCLLLCFSFRVLAQVPKLNSYPAASAVIFLDFDGHLVEGTSWNSDGPIACNSANLNTEQLTEVFSRVAEDYRPFNINVTTDSTKYWSAPARKRMRIVLTTSSSWYGSAGGVAFSNSFTWGDNTPCFVFTALLNYNVKYISEAASHEMGHTLGLNHQSSYDQICNKTSEYNVGSGSGEIGWAPIMGVGYYRNLSLWHYGSNPWGCSYMQDDLGIIAGTANGFGYRTDDHGSTVATATPASFINNQFSFGGVIEKPNDADVFSFALNAKNRVQLNALPFSASAGYNGANVDLQIELTNGTQTVIYNPESILRVSIDTTLPAGTYFVRVLSKGNTYAPDFASLGSYTLSAAMTSVTLPVHKLDLRASAEHNRHKLDWEVVADESVAEQTVELSTDGSHFQPLATTAANSRSYTYVPAKAGLLYYRLRVIFDDGRAAYTNTTALRSGAANSKPFLVGNKVSSALSVNSPSSFVYTIFDLSGRQVAKGQLTQGLNRVETGAITHGLYLILYTNNREQYTEKFMKQ